MQLIFCSKRFRARLTCYQIEEISSERQIMNASAISQLNPAKGNFFLLAEPFDLLSFSWTASALVFRSCIAKEYVKEFVYHSHISIWATNYSERYEDLLFHSNRCFRSNWRGYVDKLASEGGTRFVDVFPPRRSLNFDKFMRQPWDAVRLSARDEINLCTSHKGHTVADRKIGDGRAW